MKILLTLPAAALLLAACATTPDTGDQYAKADCKVAPVTTRNAAGGDHLGTYNELDQRYAQMQLSTSEYRRQLYARQGLSPNNVEDTLKNCY
jgi:hypothetical protein